MRALPLLCIVAAASAGCAAPEAGCEPPFPLVLRAYPQVGNASILEVQTTLWNCTDRPILLLDPCEAREGIMPAVLIDEVPRYLAHPLNATAAPRELVECWDSPVPARTAAEPGSYFEQRYRWDGSYLDADGRLLRAEPGEHTIRVRAGGYEASQTVEVPW